MTALLRLARHGTLSFAMSWPLMTASAAAQDATAAQTQNLERLKVCVSSHEQAQVSRNQGDLLAARSAALACSQAACPAIVQNDCLQWFSDIDRDVPSVLVRVRSGELDVEARVFVDGRPQPPDIFGRALELNPGRHRFRVEPRNAPPQEREVLLAPNEKARAVHFDLPQASGNVARETPRARGPRPVPVTTFVLGGAALALAAGGAVLGSWALSDRAEQVEDGGCSPSCTDHEVASIDNKALAADVFFGLGVAAGAAAVLSYVWRPELAAPSGKSRARLSLTAGRDAALVGMRGSF
jgi:hypothetical protein